MTTEFQQLVWEKLNQIPKGKITTYGDLAAALGSPRAARAVGSACGANPDLITVPCHRVVSSDGRVGQYAAGTKQKIILLEQEGLQVDNGKIVDFENKRHRW